MTVAVVTIVVLALLWRALWLSVGFVRIRYDVLRRHKVAWPLARSLVELGDLWMYRLIYGRHWW